MSGTVEQVGRFAIKRTPSLDRVERYRGIAIMFAEQGDTVGSRDMMMVVNFFSGLRGIQRLPSEHKHGGMDRKGT